jgi:hypothetical protein
MKKWGFAIIALAFVLVLYFIECSKIKTDETSNAMPTLDQLEFSESARNWNEFYKVRATIIDGQSASFEIPQKLKNKEGQQLELSGAAVFFSPGCTQQGDKIAVHALFLYPTLGLANACSHLPEVAMRWTIGIHLQEPYLLANTDMIDAMIKVKGTFRVDTSKPYESIFFLDNAQMELIENREDD